MWSLLKLIIFKTPAYNRRRYPEAQLALAATIKLNKLRGLIGNDTDCDLSTVLKSKRH